jgi:ABC-type sugar transport system ATPase subunit
MRDGRHIVSRPVKGLTHREIVNHIENLDLKFHPGEIVGIAGLGGSGRSRLLKMIYGEQKRQRGEIRIDGVPCQFRSALDALGAGVGLVTEDRSFDGFVATLSALHKVCDPCSIAALAPVSIVDNGASTRMVHRQGR